MKIGVISDTHIPQAAKDIPAMVLRDFKSVDAILHCGDILDKGIIDKLSGLCKNIHVVAGNMDSPEVKEKFPSKKIIKIAGMSIGMIHGQGAPSALLEMVMDSFKQDKVNIIVFGHSHSPFCSYCGDVLFFNPGSPTDKIFSPYNSYGIIEISHSINARIIRINR